MICDQDLREKIEIIKLLLSFSFTVFNLMKLLPKTFILKLYAQINILKKVELPFCVIFLIWNMN